MVASLADLFIRGGGNPADVGDMADPHDVGQLAEPLRSRIYTVIQDAPNNGLTLVSGRRSPWQQYLLRAGRVGASLAFNRNYPGVPRTAIPYSSEHQKGKAADMGGTAMSWLSQNRTRYGLARTVSSESWHYEAIGTPTARILPYPGSEPKEPFTVAQYEEIMKRLDAIQAELKAAKTRDEDWMQPTTVRVRELKESLEEGGTIDKNRLEPTTRRVRELHEKAF
jgi:hypothetical protein